MNELKEWAAAYAAAADKKALEKQITNSVQRKVPAVAFVFFNNIGWVATDIDGNPILTAIGGRVAPSVCCPKRYKETYFITY